MTDPRPPLAAFDEATIEAAARAADLPPADLRSLVVRHQEVVRELPGVDDIVYEWRNHFHRDPLVHRTDAVYVLAVPAHVWDEYGDALDAGAAELDALRAVHDRQARTVVDEPGADRFDDDPAIVLTRP